MTARTEPRPSGHPATDIVAVTLDAAGTLVTLREPVGEVYARLAGSRPAGSRPAGSPSPDSRPRSGPDPEEIERAFRRQLRRMPPLAFPPLPEPELRRRERRWWRELVRRVATEVDDLPPPGRPDGWFDELYDHYAGRAAWRAFDEVPTVLEQLHDAGLRLAVVTNFDSRVESVMEELGLAPFLDAVVTSSRAGVAKPEPAIFHEALRRLDSPAGGTLHVGDRPDDDLEGARSAGLQALLLRRSLGHAPPASGEPAIADLRGVLHHLGLASDRAPAETSTGAGAN